VSSYKYTHYLNIHFTLTTTMSPILMYELTKTVNQVSQYAAVIEDIIMWPAMTYWD